MQGFQVGLHSAEALLQLAEAQINLVKSDPQHLETAHGYLVRLVQALANKSGEQHLEKERLEKDAANLARERSVFEATATDPNHNAVLRQVQQLGNSANERQQTLLNETQEQIKALSAIGTNMTQASQSARQAHINLSTTMTDSLSATQLSFNSEISRTTEILRQIQGRMLQSLADSKSATDSLSLTTSNVSQISDNLQQLQQSLTAASADNNSALNAGLDTATAATLSLNQDVDNVAASIGIVQQRIRDSDTAISSSFGSQRQLILQVLRSITERMGNCLTEANTTLAQGFSDLPNRGWISDMLSSCTDNITQELIHGFAATDEAQRSIHFLISQGPTAIDFAAENTRISQKLERLLELVPATIGDRQSIADGIAELRDHVRELDSTKQQRIDQLQQELNASREVAQQNATRLSDATRQASMLQADAQVKTAQVDHLESIVDTANSDMVRLEQLLRVADISRSKVDEQVVQLRQDLANANANVLQIGQNTRDSAQHVSRLELAVTTMTKRANDAEKMSQTLLTSLTKAGQQIKTIESATRNSKSLESVAGALGAKLESMAAATANVDNLKAQLCDRQQEIARHVREIGQLKRDNASLKREQDQTNNANYVLQRSMETLSRDKRVMEAQVTALETQIETMNRRQQSPPPSQPRKRSRLSDDAEASGSHTRTNAIANVYAQLAQSCNTLQLVQHSAAKVKDIAADLFYLLLENGVLANMGAFLDRGRVNAWFCYMHVARHGDKSAQETPNNAQCKYHGNKCMVLRVVIRDGQRHLEFFRRGEP